MRMWVAADVLPREIFAFTANATRRVLVADMPFLSRLGDSTPVHGLNTRNVPVIWDRLTPLAIGGFELHRDVPSPMTTLAKLSGVTPGCFGAHLASSTAALASAVAPDVDGH
jgi:hypothetical protein